MGVASRNLLKRKDTVRDSLRITASDKISVFLQLMVMFVGFEIVKRGERWWADGF